MSTLEQQDRVAQSVGTIVNKHGLTSEEQEEIILLIERRTIEIVGRRTTREALDPDLEAEIEQKSEAQMTGDSYTKPAARPPYEYTPEQKPRPHEPVAGEDDYDDDECDDYLRDPAAELRRLVRSQPGTGDTSERLIGARPKGKPTGTLEHTSKDVVLDELPQSCDT